MRPPVAIDAVGADAQFGGSAFGTARGSTIFGLLPLLARSTRGRKVASLISGSLCPELTWSRCGLCSPQIAGLQVPRERAVLLRSAVHVLTGLAVVGFSDTLDNYVGNGCDSGVKSAAEVMTRRGDKEKTRPNAREGSFHFPSFRSNHPGCAWT